MSPDYEDELCSGLLVHVDYASPKQSEFCARQFGNIKAERNPALKPRFDRVPVSRNDIYRVGACEGTYVQVCDFTERIHAARPHQPDGGSRNDNGQHGEGHAKRGFHLF